MKIRKISLIVSFVILAVYLIAYGIQAKNEKNDQGTMDAILEILYQDCLASKNTGDLQAAYIQCGKLVSLAPNYADGQAQLIDVRVQLLADYYDAGVAAFNQELWAESILWFDKVLELDLSYRDTTSLKARATANNTVIISATVQTMTPHPVPVVTATTIYSTTPFGSNMLANDSFDEDYFTVIGSWAHTNIDLYRWHLVQNTQSSRWVEWVELSDGERGRGLKSTDYQDCSAWCSTSAVQIVPAQENKTYTLLAEAMREQGTGGTIYMDFLNANRGRIKPHTKGGYGEEWSTQEITAVAPAGTHYIRVILYTNNGDQGVVYWDNIELKEN